MSDKSRLSVFVLIDALGWRLLEGHEFLSDILPFRTPLRTVLGFSSGAIPSILTGLAPVKTGHWNLLYYDPEGSPFKWLRFFAPLPQRMLDNRFSRKLLKELGRRVLGMGPAFECCVSPRLLPLFNWAERRNIYSRRGITGAPSIFDRLDRSGIPYRAYSYHRWTDSQILRRAQADLREGKANFYFVYLSEMDSFLHDSRHQPERLQRRLDWYAAGLRNLYQQAADSGRDFVFTVFSDHGMAPVSSHHDVAAEVESLGFDMPRDYLAVYDSTMARYWFFSERARREIKGRLSQLPCGRILGDDELKDLGILFPDHRYGQAIFLLKPGFLIARGDFNGPSWTPAGMHGYHPDDPDSDAVFLSNGRPSVEVRTISDVYHCMMDAAGLLDAAAASSTALWNRGVHV